MKFIKIIFPLALLLLSTNSFADAQQTLSDLQHQWATAQYTLHDEAQEQAFETLLEQAEQGVSTYPESAELWVWKGIISSSYAGIKGGLGVLHLVYNAKDDFEKAMSIDDTALAGSAYTSLGTLYFKVPGWPIAYGDDDKAKVFLTKALTLNPMGIDSNYFYAQYLIAQDDYTQAEQYLIKAQLAPPRPSRPLADQGRQQEIALSLASVRKALAR